MKTHTDSETVPAVYVGTYAKYNGGSIAGAWLKLEDYADKDDFLAACRELHKDESDPELMFQDFEGFPREYYGECSLKDTLWDWLALDEDDRKLLEIYSGNGCGDDIESAREAFQGKWDSLEAYAENFLEETRSLEAMPENLRPYFDFAAYARDLRCGGDVWTHEEDGEVWVFWNR